MKSGDWQISGAFSDDWASVRSPTTKQELFADVIAMMLLMMLMLICCCCSCINVVLGLLIGVADDTSSPVITKYV